MKTIIIGANHAGIATANTLIEHNPDHKITMIDKNDNISYIGAGTAMWIGRQIEKPENLFYQHPSDFEDKGVSIHLNTEVTSVDFSNKLVEYTLPTGEYTQENYDKLVIATGSRPIVPNIPGKDLGGIHFAKLYQESQSIDAELENSSIQRVAVIGAGYIGTEMAEAIQRRGKEVLLFDAEETSLSSYYDPEMTQIMDENLKLNKVNLHFKEKVQEFKGENNRVSSLATDKGEYEVDLVINCIGFLPNNVLGGNHLEKHPNGAILVDSHQETSLQDVYAVGDVATSYNNALQDTSYIALASNAIRSGIVAGRTIAGEKISSPGVQGSNGISIFGLHMTSTGVSLKAAERFGLDVDYTDYEDSQKSWFLEEDNDIVTIRIVFEKTTRRIVGAQMASRNEIIAGNINMFSLAIQEHLTIDELSLLDLFFLPHFNSPYNYMTMAALSLK